MVISVGDIMVDIYLNEPSKLNPDTDTEGRTRIRWGGSAANFAVWAARLGCRSALVGKVGGDFIGKAAIEDMRSEGVLPLIAMDTAAETGTVVVRSRGGEGREMICDRKANAKLSEEDLPLQMIREAEYIHISGYTVIEEGPRQAVISCIREAKKGGTLISVDPGSCSLIGEIGVERFLEAVKGADIVMPNLEEAKLLTGLEDPIEMAQKLAGSFRMAVVKLGPEGAVLAERGKKAESIPAFKAEAVDVNGAGDSFAAGFAACYISYKDAALAAEAGCAIASQVVQAEGARPKIALEQILRRYL